MRLCVCMQRAVCVFTVHTAVLGWQGLWHHSHPCQNDGKRTGKREKLSHLFTAQCRHSDREGNATAAIQQTLTPLTTSPLHPSQLQRSARTQLNSNHKHNPTRTNQRHTERSLKWPLLSNPLGDDLPNVKDRNLKLDLKRLNRTLHKTVRDYMTYFVSKEHSQWCVYMYDQFTGDLMDF